MVDEMISSYDYHSLLQELCLILPPKKYKAVYGYPRGGLIPAVHISHFLGIPLVTKIPKNFDIPELLIVDDIVDSGRTLDCYSKYYDIASLFWRKSVACFEPTYWIRDAKNKWIDFPYEKGGSGWPENSLI